MKRILLTFIRLLIFVIPCLSIWECLGTNYKTIERITYKDSTTGNIVWQITSHDSISEAFYFYANSFTSDDRYAIFRSKRSGRWEVYRYDLLSGEIDQLTDEGISDACIHPNGKDMCYISGWKYCRMDVHSKIKTEVLEFTGKLHSVPHFRPTFTNDGRFTLVYTRDGDINCLYRVDITSGEILKVFDEKNSAGFSHQLINPVDPNIITYVPLPDTQNELGLPMEKRPRTRIIKVDQGTNAPFLITPYHYRATHDSWSPLGDRLFFFEKTVPDWIPASVGSVDIKGKNYTRHYTSNSIMLGHGTVSRDGIWFVTDGQESNKNPLILINLRDGKAKFLCWPNASINTPARVHVHPNFSLSGDYVIYTSDVTEVNKSQVYIIPIKEIKDRW